MPLLMNSQRASAHAQRIRLKPCRRSPSHSMRRHRHLRPRVHRLCRPLQPQRCAGGSVTARLNRRKICFHTFQKCSCCFSLYFSVLFVAFHMFSMIFLAPSCFSLFFLCFHGCSLCFLYLPTRFLFFFKVSLLVLVFSLLFRVIHSPWGVRRSAILNKSRYRNPGFSVFFLCRS